MIKLLRNKKVQKKIWIVLAIIIVPAFVLWGSASLLRGPKEEKHSATENEVSLAGKGFTQEVEDELRSENPEMKFDLVEDIERYAVSESDLFEFIKKGGLFFP